MSWVGWAMFSVVVPGRRRAGVRLKGTGTFFCLNCESMRHFELREWHGTEFVLCGVCELAFRPECLDESSDAHLEELVIDDLPERAICAKARIVRTPPADSGYEHVAGFCEDDSVATSWLAPAEELRVNPRSDSVIAYTSGRRH